ncbi:hypothetical protein NDU88_002702 [Pleurodeles waltl]|uniref:Uncharacterized protein n=1 Tax=Pleurodeles waltl TaxID=8319 RepID=A0AAV7W3K2_PLEWA|nr:hypothetical protein NDU88_002702 [Pleurodeles waltl]
MGRPDPHNSIACADSATNDLETNGDSDALVGWLPLSREQPQVKSGDSLMSENVRSWSRNILGPVVTEERQEWKEQEDVEAGNTETAGRNECDCGAIWSRGTAAGNGGPLAPGNLLLSRHASGESWPSQVRRREQGKERGREAGCGEEWGREEEKENGHFGGREGEH